MSAFKLLIGSDFHLCPDIQSQTVAKLQTGEYDGFIFCGDFCNLAGLAADRYGGCNPRGLNEVDALHSFFSEIDKLTDWIAVPGNHDPNANYLPGAGATKTNGVPNVLDREYRKGKFYTEWQFVRLPDWGNSRALIIPYTPNCGWNWVLNARLPKVIQEAYWFDPVCDGLSTRTETDYPQIDLLVTHAPPKGILDGGIYHYDITLLPVLRTVMPKYYLCGHIHQDGGKMAEFRSDTGVTRVINSATKLTELRVEAI